MTLEEGQREDRRLKVLVQGQLLGPCHPKEAPVERRTQSHLLMLPRGVHQEGDEGELPVPRVREDVEQLELQKQEPLGELQ